MQPVRPARMPTREASPAEAKDPVGRANVRPGGPRQPKPALKMQADPFGQQQASMPQTAEITETTKAIETPQKTEPTESTITTMKPEVQHTEPAKHVSPQLEEQK